MPGEFTLGETTLGDTLPAVAGPPASANLGASALLDRQNVKARWGERYTSDAVNKKFVGFPRGIYYGLIPVPDGLTLLLKPDQSLYFTNISGAPQIGETVTGGNSNATATIRAISPGFLMIDEVFGDFQVGDPLTGQTSGFSAELTNIGSDLISFARVTSNTPTVTGRTEHMLDIVTTDTVAIDFTGFSDGTYYVYVTGSYQVGSTTIATVQSRTTPPPNGLSEVLVCVVQKVSTTITVQASSPTTRQEPFAAAGQRIGFMPAGSIENLQAATLTTQEVIAAREGVDGVVAPGFDLALPQTTGLPARLREDLSRASMASRLGKSVVTVRSNDYAVTGPILAGSTINISGSFAARARDFQPIRDVTNEAVPAGVPVPLAIEPDGSEVLTLEVTVNSGTFGIGEVIVGADSGAQAIIRATTVASIDIDEIVGVFLVGEDVDSAGPPTGNATIDAIDRRTGAITATDGGGGGDPVRNIVAVSDTFSGKKPVDTSGNPIYGRLYFGPDGIASPGGGDPGELLVGVGIGEVISFFQGSTTVTNTGINFTNYFLPGDIIEGADGRFYEIDPTPGSVLSTSLTLTAGKPYLGPDAIAGNGLPIGPRRRRRFLVKFVSFSGGAETAKDITPGTTIPAGSDLRLFFPCWLESDQSHFDADMDMQAPGDVFTIATDVTPGVAYNAPGTGGGTGTGIPVIGAIRTIQQNGSAVGNGNFHTINFTAGAASSPSPGVLTITAAGPPGPPGAGGAGSPGPTGPTGLGYSVIYPYQPKERAINAYSVFTDTIGFTFPGNYRFFMVSSALKNADGELDTGSITGVAAAVGTNNITVSVRLDGGSGGSGLNQVMVVGAAAAG